jgi:uncharacterized protein involved in exopolysaccharide biosynthesis
MENDLEYLKHQQMQKMQEHIAELQAQVEHWKRKYRDMHNNATHAMCRLHELEKERQNR